MNAARKKQASYRHGLWAEKLAGLYLRAKGHEILATRYKTPGGEADIISVQSRTLVITEVKARKVLGDALESVTVRNRQRIESAARHYIAHNPDYADYDVRFDVIALARPFSIRHLDNAWRPEA